MTDDDRQVKDQNDSVKPDEQVWLQNSLAQDAEVSASEVEFFKTLRGRRLPKQLRPIRTIRK